jgi:hypothetical protein
MRLLLTIALATMAAGQQPAPVLRFEPPPNFTRSASTPPEDYSSNEFNAGVQIYPFRPFRGDIEQMFRKTLLREWIDSRYQEANVAGPPDFRRGTVRGAEIVFTARFAENIAGILRQRMRMVIVADSCAAVVDASANNLATWQRALPALNAMDRTFQVEVGAEEASSSATNNSAVAGLYMGTKSKYVVNLNRAVGYGNWVTALHYYLFSADGRVYRAYDDISVPGGDIRRFDFDAAQRADPVNSGRYTIRGDQMRIQMSGQPPETITVTAPKDNRVTINSVLYIRQ